MESIYKAPDTIGNLFRTEERKDRKYGKGGRLLEDRKYSYHYDGEGNLVLKQRLRPDGSATPLWLEGDWAYEWQGNSMLRSVKRPDGEIVSFEYDPLGRRISKSYQGKTTRWVWDGNVPLHEWTEEADVTTWLFEENTFIPAAKIVGDKSYSIVTDYLGTPTAIYDANGTKTWSAELDMYGSVRNFAGRSLSDCPFRYQGQYFDSETELCYNRFRYYSPDEGMYISQDPIGLDGNNPNIYAYVSDTNGWIDPLGLLSITKTVDFTGHPDLYQGKGKNIVTIKLTGDRNSDFTRAFREAGISKSDAIGYTWHHVADFDPKTGTSTMQLVKTSTHEANLLHKGSAGQFAEHFEVEYDSYAAKMKAFEQGWRDKPKRRKSKSGGHH